MKHLSLLAASILTLPSAGQVAVFPSSTSTLKCTGNTVIASTITVEARLWLGADSPSVNIAGRIWTEQQDSVEDKNLTVGPDGIDSGACCSSQHHLTWRGTVPTEAWVHVAAVFEVPEARLYVDGVLVHTTFIQGPILNSSGSWMAIGAGDYSVGPGTDIAPGFHGQLDWLRVSSVARYSGSEITPPSECELVPSDESTALLLLFNDPIGSKELLDLGAQQMTVTVDPWFVGATTPVLSGDRLDGDSDGIPDCCATLLGCRGCPADLNDDAIVNGSDIAVLLGFWGPVGAFPAADLNSDGVVNGAEIAIVLGAWGPCE